MKDIFRRKQNRETDGTDPNFSAARLGELPVARIFSHFSQRTREMGHPALCTTIRPLRCLLLLIQSYLFINSLLPLGDRCSNRLLFGVEFSDNPKAKCRCR